MIPVPEPFTIRIEPAILRELRQRLRNARFPPDIGGEDGAYGVPPKELASLAAEWLALDWDAVETEMNRFEHFRVRIFDQPIHFMRVRSARSDARPIIVSHGWPWTFWTMHRLATMLAHPETFGADPGEAFDVIVPSLPGFGFSTPSSSPGVNFWKTADQWHHLMTNVLHFPRFAVAGGDWGALISTQLGHKYASDVIGVHITQPLIPSQFSSDKPWDVAQGKATRADLDMTQGRALMEHQRKYTSHLAVQVIEPLTLAFAMHDSPFGLLAWIWQRWRTWSPASLPEMIARNRRQALIDATLYWATDSFASAARYYADAARYAWKPTHPRRPLVEAPTGISLFETDALPPGEGDAAARFRRTARADDYNLQFLAAHEQGGHFAHFEQPEAVAQDIRSLFRHLR